MPCPEFERVKEKIENIKQLDALLTGTQYQTTEKSKVCNYLNIIYTTDLSGYSLQVIISDIATTGDKQLIKSIREIGS